LSEGWQCFPPETKAIEFFTDSDKSLGQFLLQNCFDLKLRCLYSKCKREVLRHILSYTHSHGSVVIRAQRIEGGGIPTFQGRGEVSLRKKDKKDSALRMENGEMENGEKSSSSSSALAALDNGGQGDIRMWSRCKVAAASPSLLV
jgi:hypothetical protein